MWAWCYNTTSTCNGGHLQPLSLLFSVSMFLFASGFSNVPLWLCLPVNYGSIVLNAAQYCLLFFQILRFKVKDGLIDGVEQLYMNEGSEYSGGSVATIYNKQLLIGAIATEPMICEMK